MTSTTEKSAKKAKNEDDVVKPSRPVTAYIYFSNEAVPKIKAETGCKLTEASKIAGERWNALREEQKAPYTAKNEADKKRYQQQLQELEKKGYFIMSDGSKSTELGGASAKKKVRADASPLVPQKRTSSGKALLMSGK